MRKRSSVSYTKPNSMEVFNYQLRKVTNGVSFRWQAPENAVSDYDRYAEEMDRPPPGPRSDPFTVEDVF